MTESRFVAPRERQALPDSPQCPSRAWQGFAPSHSPEGIGKPAGNTSSGKTGSQPPSTILLTIQVTITSSVRRAHNRVGQVGVDANAGESRGGGSWWRSCL